MKNKLNPKDIQGLKKVQLHLFPAQVIAETTRALEEGANKYGAYNWRKEKVLASQYLSATLRHLQQWQEGEDIDIDSGLNHITKAIATLVVFRDAMMNNMWKDDRPPKIEDYSLYRNRVDKKVKKWYNRQVITITTNMKSAITSASKFVFILLAVTACIGFSAGLLEAKDFMLLATGSFSFYFANKGDSSQPYAGK